MPCKLIVNADDFGLSEGVSRGIIQAHRMGIVTSTTFMVNFPWAPEVSALLRDVPDLGVGIHLNLTAGSPVLPPAQVPSLVTHEGTFSRSLWRMRYRVSQEDARQEWSAQVQRGMQLLGRLPTHLDTHKYLQGFPCLSEVMIEVARSYRIPAVRCLYPGPDLDQSIYSRWSPAGMVVARYLKRSLSAVRQSGLGHPTAVMAGDLDLPRLLHKLDRVGEGVTELVCHPGLVDEQLGSLTSLVAQREVELTALTAPQVRDRIADRGIELISFREIAPAV